MTTSKLETSRDRYLSVCLQQALDDGWLSPESFTEEFPPQRLMEALEPATALRSRLLVEAAGVHEKIAPKKSTTAAAEDLQIALEEGICTPRDLLNLVSIDDHVRYLDTESLWTLLIRDKFWKNNDARGRVRMLHMLNAGLEQQLINLPRILVAIKPERLASDLPRNLVEQLLSLALNLGLEAAPLDPAKLVDQTSLDVWLEHIALIHVWETAIAEIAGSAGFSGPPGSPKTDKRTPEVSTTTPDKSGKARPSTQTLAGSPAPPPVDSAPAPATDAGAAASGETSQASEAELKARQEAIDGLTQIERLPPRAKDLSTPILLALEAMYADLFTFEDDELRSECIDDAFPNEAMKTEALMALAEALDPRLTESELKARKVDGDSLRQLILFEERRRANRSAGLSPSSPPPLPGVPNSPPPLSHVSNQGGVSVPPPLPTQAARRASTPPPPLPAQAARRPR